MGNFSCFLLHLTKIIDSGNMNWEFNLDIMGNAAEMIDFKTYNHYAQDTNTTAFLSFVGSIFNKIGD